MSGLSVRIFLVEIWYFRGFSSQEIKRKCFHRSAPQQRHDDERLWVGAHVAESLYWLNVNVWKFFESWTWQKASLTGWHTVYHRMKTHDGTRCNLLVKTVPYIGNLCIHFQIFQGMHDIGCWYFCSHVCWYQYFSLTAKVFP